MSKPVKVVHTSRTVLEHKLLDALEDNDKVAAIFTKADLEVLIFALDAVIGIQLHGKECARTRSLLDGLTKLKSEAFQ